MLPVIQLTAERQTHVVVRGAAVVAVHRRLGRQRRGAVSVLDHKVYRHLAFQTADVSVTEVVAQLVNLSSPHNTLRLYIEATD